MSQGGYLLLSTVAFFLTGIGLYAVDRKLTVAFRRFLHEWTSPESEPFPESKRKGLVYGQKARQRFAVAGAISLIQTLIAVKSLEYNPLYELMTLLIESPIMVLGTYLGDRAGRLFSRADPVFDAIDRIDAGETSAGEEAQELVRGLAGRMRGKDAAKSATEKAEPADKREPAAEPAARPAEEPPPSEEPDEDPRELMRKYTGD